MNHDTLYTLLNQHYEAIDKIILSRQDPITGLLPASTAVNAHGDYTDAWVRDNVYSILSVWGLALAYKKHAPEHHRSFVLSQSVVKLMRGLLSAMMRQADHVETFKKTLNPLDALHAKYGTKTGLAVVGDGEWGHLQLDASSLYLLMIAQMTASGLRLIYTMDEVNFIQNMVHYISRTYCTPDYGIWERGNKINSGATEINCSSVGMAKAALEALSGFNLFGNVATQEAVIHVIPNDIARSRFTLKGLLPRESNSKETDAALLSIIGYPAYAVEDEELVSCTRDKVIKKLAGNYGCKRFLLDGHQSSIEDGSRLHYESSELREFEHIESEWPLFFTYLLLDAIMRHDHEAIAQWKNRLEPLFVEQDGVRLIPELYIVPLDRIAAEKENPGSQERIANENLPLVWAQSLYMLSDMILDGVLRPGDIDPLHRRERIGHIRHTQTLVPILAENEAVKQKLLDLGYSSETLEDVKPIKVMHAQELSNVHTFIGQNSKLGLSGRPLLETRSITTSRLHLLEGNACIFLPYYFNPKGFYFSYDNELLVQHFRSSLRFLSQHWDQPGQPIIAFLVRETMLHEDDRDVILELFHDFQTNKCENIIVKTGPLEQLLTTAATERIDCIHQYELQELDFSSHEDHEYYEATRQHDWKEIRRIADEHSRYDDRLEDALLNIVIHQKRLAVGRAYDERATFNKPHESAAISRAIDEFCGQNSAEHVLTQEIILHLGHLIRNESELFKDILTLRTWYFVQLLVGHITHKHALSVGDGYEFLLHMPPNKIYNMLRDILRSFREEVTQLHGQEILHAQGIDNIDTIRAALDISQSNDIEDWASWRERSGMIGRLTPKFYKDVWYLLQQCHGLVIGDKYNINNRLGSELTLESTAGERSFALSVEALLHSIGASDYRQLNIEALESLSRVFRKNSSLHLENDLVLDVLIGHAVRIGWSKGHSLDHYDEERAQAWEAMYKMSAQECDALFIEAFVHLIKNSEE